MIRIIYRLSKAIQMILTALELDAVKGIEKYIYFQMISIPWCHRDRSAYNAIMHITSKSIWLELLYQLFRIFQRFLQLKLLLHKYNISSSETHLYVARFLVLAVVVLVCYNLKFVIFAILLFG